MKKMEIKNKFGYFILILIITIVITRIITSFRDPNYFMGIFEVHHFYYGLIILILIHCFILFGRRYKRIYLIFSAISLGLILDELLFIMGKIRGPITYESTLTSTIILTIIIILIGGIIYYTSKGK